MKIQRLLVTLTVLNAGAVMFSLAQSRPASQEVAPVLRGRAFEIVDANGKVRASISIIPGDPSYKMPDGTVGYPETVLFRLINSKGRPNVKIAATEDGSGLGLGGDKDPTYIQMLANRTTATVKLTDQSGKEQLLKP